MFLCCKTDHINAINDANAVDADAADDDDDGF